MKKQITIISIAALTLFACGGANQNSGNNSAQTTAIDTISAFELYKKFYPELADKHKDADTSGKLYYSFYDPESYNEYGGPFINLYYLNLNDGGNLIVYQHTENGMLDDDGSSQIHLFRYINGELSEADDLLPTPSFNDFAQLEGLTFYNPEQRLIDFFDKKDFSYCYELDPKTMIVAVRIYVFNDLLSLYYKWDGSKFVLDSKRDPETPQNLICYSGLGRVLLGDNPPEEILGFQKNTLGKTVYFNRNGQKMFKLSLDANDKIDTITVLSPLYTFRIDCDGPTNDHFGIGYKPVDFCSNDDFVSKDGVWIRRFTGGYDYFCGIINDTRKADSLNVIEFYTTKDAITNIEPEDGKTVNWRDHPEYNPNATVTLVKIYHGQVDLGREIFHLLIKEHEKMGDNNDLLNYDDRADEEYNKNKTDNGLDLRDNGSHEVYTHIFKYFPLNGGGYKVYEYVAWEHGFRYDPAFDPFEEKKTLYCFVYNNGSLTPAALEPEIDPEPYSPPFTDKGLKGFDWNGERMVKQEE